eukprot:TRINITY_DN2402_c0_g4_i1.p2 TRINITY_DN2402_c0_g4~~TRINITY_DN2402_c0_g4_i1.p2  ORF type:complete len:133 (-),score=61.18 TRINITY_DN2402_c0_g4_i1:3-401(-)
MNVSDSSSSSSSSSSSNTTQVEFSHPFRFNVHDSQLGIDDPRISQFLGIDDDEQEEEDSEDTEQLVEEEQQEEEVEAVDQEPRINIVPVMHKDLLDTSPLDEDDDEDEDEEAQPIAGLMDAISTSMGSSRTE